MIRPKNWVLKPTEVRYLTHGDTVAGPGGTCLKTGATSATRLNDGSRHRIAEDKVVQPVWTEYEDVAWDDPPAAKRCIHSMRRPDDCKQCAPDIKEKMP